MLKIKSLLPAFALFALLFFTSKTYATHIIGGELSYECMGGNTYELTLKVYRDCFNGIPPLDDPAYIFVFNSTGGLVQTLTLNTPQVSNIPPELDNPCLVVPPNVCVEEGIYTTQVNLPPIAGGYTLVYQRCCRNGTIVNMVAPEDAGDSFIAHIPDPAVVTCNNSPVFNNFPPIVICANVELVFDHSATDLDGDSLVYELCAPFLGASPTVPQPDPFTPPPPPPYTNISYLPGYSATNPLDASPALSIDPQTGLLTGTPTTEGQYVVGVCVREYRNGVLIATHIRDFQFNVSECIPVVVASLPDQIISCDDLEISVGNNSLGAIEYFWDFGDPTTTSDTTSAEFPPNYIYPDTGTYTITLIANPGAPCADTATALVTAYPNLTPGFSVVAGCAGQPVVFTDSSVTTFGVLDEWLWNFGDGQTGTAQNPEHQYGAGGNYTATLVVTTDKGCIDTISKSFTVMDGPNADFTADDVCEGEEVFFDDLSVVPVGIIVDYDWDLGDGTVSADTEPTHTYNSTGSYDVTLILLSDNDCNDTITRTVVVGEVPTVDAGPDETIEFGQSTTLNGTSSGTTYSWIPPETLSDPNSPNPTAEPTETTTYYLTVTSDDNCEALDSVTIYVDPLSILNVPNAFSPNNDGTNDILEIHHNDIQELIYFRIYNRWGQMIYETSDLMAGWDGTYKGKEQEVATYVYVAKATGLDGTDFLLKGNVTLLR